MELFVVLSLALLRGHAGAGSAADHDGLRQNVGGGSADVGTRSDDFAGFEDHLAGGVADFGDLANGLNVIAGVNGSEEFNVVVCAEETFIAVLHNQQFGSHVAEKCEHVCTIN